MPFVRRVAILVTALCATITCLASPHTTKMPILSISSVNVDETFKVPHIVVEGETLSSFSTSKHVGGKGANQCVSAARALGNQDRKQVFFSGCVGVEGRELIKSELERNGVDVGFSRFDDDNPTGRALIQVSEETSDNAIVLVPGTNHMITSEQVDNALTAFPPNTYIMLQNEINNTPEIIQKAGSKGMAVVFNPAPFPSNITRYNLEYVNILITNEIETRDLLKQLLPSSTGIPSSLHEVSEVLPALEILVVTKGKHGVTALHRNSKHPISLPALPDVQAVDTTGAGDTFVGYLVAHLSQHKVTDITTDILKHALMMAVVASGMACEQVGAMTSPKIEDVLERAKLVGWI